MARRGESGQMGQELMLRAQVAARVAERGAATQAGRAALRQHAVAAVLGEPHLPCHGLPDALLLQDSCYGVLYNRSLVDRRLGQAADSACGNGLSKSPT
ncbi:hypothetical protein RR48_09905 [Papilio machaon]|uniref:Uncharacterized protein n=1 Tax=Papilio machaon TaxID=76193 RepID=A0A194REG4_PAPMA|nr:hypothetical protein RR48_09905 [Papilio machaon]